MHNIFELIVALLGLIYTEAIEQPIGKLQHLHILFRHGDRTPAIDFINNASVWPIGLGQLTDTGIVQEFQLGQWIRREYNHFIPMTYNASEFYMRSTDIDRTLQSGQSVSAGIYQNGSTPLSDYSINWRPIPVHTVPQIEDILLSWAPCPCLRALQDAQFASERALKYEREHSTLFKTLTDHVGQKITTKNIWMVYDILTCMRAHKIPWPSWMSDTMFKEIIDVVTFYWKVEFTDSRETLRLEIGVFLDTVLKHISSVVHTLNSPGNPHHKMSIQHTMAYSAHDTDVSFVIGALASFDELVHYSGAVVLELWGPDPPENAPSDYYLRLRYKRGYDYPGKYVPITPCGEDSAERGCSLDKVFDYLKPMRLTELEYNQACAVTQVFRGENGTVKCLYTPDDKGHVATYIIVIIVVAICVVIVALVASFVIARRRRTANQMPFVHLNPEA